MPSEFLAYFRCSSELDRFDVPGDLSARAEFFSHGDAICFGRRSTAQVVDADRRKQLPFDLSEVALNLLHERYCAPREINGSHRPEDFVRAAYYFVRPVLPVSVRKHLQRLRLRGWDRIPFPRWPVDFSVDSLMRSALAVAMRNSCVTEVPFVWFWPAGASGCCILTHDVEAPPGYDFCGALMDIDESYGFNAAFQVVPELRYKQPQLLCRAIRDRGFEVNVHDLNHDGHLFEDRRTFLERANRVNQYGRDFKSRGFRAAAMYRNQAWLDELEFSYDMSVPNVAHLEPQRGGCCTVMPYFIGNMVELPLTTIQDYSLFHIIGDYSIDRWKEQVDMILKRHGLITVLSHPDYLIEQRARGVYAAFLDHLRKLRTDRNVWCPLPRDVDAWWRSRNEMSVVRDGTSWRIVGPESDRARVAMATLHDDDQVSYRLLA